MNVRYLVELSQAERGELTALLSGGKHAARKLKRAQILLAADAGACDEDIAISVGVGGSTVYRTKRRFVVGNLEEALGEEPRPGASRKLSGKEEALLVATTCSNPPKGRARWTLELLADELVRLTEHDSISRAPSAGRKRPQAVAQGHVVHSAYRRRVRRSNGGCARPVCAGA
jgi:transposase